MPTDLPGDRPHDHLPDDRPRRRRPPPPKKGGHAVWIVLGVVVILGTCSVPVLVGLLLPAVQKVREAAGRDIAIDNFKQVGIAMHRHQDQDKTQALPRDIAGKDGRPLLSWRVALLPYVEQNALYNQFKLDEPWDGPANLPLLGQMPKVYASPRGPAAPGMTRMQAFIGPHTPFNPEGKPCSLVTIPDGSSNTLLCVEAATLVEWTKPGDMPYTPDGPLPALGVGGKDFIALFRRCLGATPAHLHPGRSAPRRHHDRRRPPGLARALTPTVDRDVPWRTGILIVDGAGPDPRTTHLSRPGPAW